MALGLSSDCPLFDLLEGGAWSVHPTTPTIKTFKPLNSYLAVSLLCFIRCGERFSRGLCLIHLFVFGGHHQP
jgi:hypothetical protein